MLSQDLLTHLLLPSLGMRVPEDPRAMMVAGASLHNLCTPTGEPTLSRLSEQPPDSVKPTKGARQALSTHSMRSGVSPLPELP